MAAPAPWTVHTEVFEGPLDLLLYLVRRDGVDLERLQVHRICDAYLDYLERMRSLRLNVAADYLVMAATLVHLKSLSLLPRSPTPVTEDGEEEDPAEALAQRLLEYQRFKEASEALEQRAMVGRDAFVPLQMRLTVVLFRFLSVVLLIGLAATAATRGLHALPVRCASLAVAAVLINTFVVVPRALRAGGRGRQEVRGRDHEGTVTHFASAGVGQSTKIFHRLVVLFVVVMLLGIGGSLTLLITG